MYNKTDPTLVHMFPDDRTENAKRTKKRLLAFYFITLAVVLVLLVIFYLFRHEIGRGLSEFINIFITALFLGFTLFFFSIKYRLTSRYVRLIRGIETGIIEENRGIFLRYEDGVFTKDGVNFHSFLTAEKVVKRSDFPERKVLVDADVAPPEFGQFDELYYYTHSGVLVAYKVARKGEEVVFESTGKRKKD